jgi:hypothetical protein
MREAPSLVIIEQLLAMGAQFDVAVGSYGRSKTYVKIPLVYKMIMMPVWE